MKPSVWASMILVLGAAAPVAAQSFAIGPQVSFARGDVASDTPSSGYFGGTVRMHASPRIAVEGSMTFRTTTSADRTERLKERPLEASLLLYPVRSTLSPYVLVGMGVYSRTDETLDINGAVVSTTSTRQTGWQMGFGAELLFSHHTALYADYRWRNVKLGSQPSPSGGTTPASPLIPGLNTLQVSHQGSVLSGGVAFYF